MTTNLFECVINISEGRNSDLLGVFDQKAGHSLRDRHSDHFHNRSVFTLINTADALVADVYSLLHFAYNSLDLVGHEGVHPRFGVVDVVPFVALNQKDEPTATALRDQVAEEIARTEVVSIFLYGPIMNVGTRSLPEVRKHAFHDLAPDLGPAQPDPHKGASAFGSRPILVAWNLWISGLSLLEARGIARSLRSAFVRTLAFQVGADVQISFNFISPLQAGPEEAYESVKNMIPSSAYISRAELVGLSPMTMLEKIPNSKWKALGLSPSATIESRLA